MFQLTGFAAGVKWDERKAALQASLGSFRPLTDPKALAAEPMRIEIVKLTKDTTLEEFARRSSSSVPIEQLAVINHVEPNGTLRAGLSAKRIVGGKK